MCNLSRIDNTTIVLKLFTDVPFPDPSRNPPPLSIVGPSSEFFIYDTNYNVLRIMSGINPPVPNSQPLNKLFRDTCLEKWCNSKLLYIEFMLAIYNTYNWLVMICLIKLLQQNQIAGNSLSFEYHRYIKLDIS